MWPFSGSGRFEQLRKRKNRGLSTIQSMMQEMQEAKEEAEETIQELEQLEEEIKSDKADAYQVKEFSENFLEAGGVKQ